MGHGDDLRKLTSKWVQSHRYANFGPALQSMEVQGFRGVDALKIDFNSPITALSGLNGTGKSTLAQLAACAYRKPSTAAVRRYFVRDFFPVSPADPSPFSTSAKIVYAYEVQGSTDPQRVTIARATKEWSGYKRQPERACYYLGFTQFIPKVERRDFSIYGGHLIQLGAARDLDKPVSDMVAGILSLPYERLGFIEVTHSARTAELATATRNGRSYSENHMGFGEGRVVYIVTAMETAPAQSLFILEEPETSLHGDAQERLGRYLVDVAARRGHQILMTTHSAAILGQFGTDSIAYLRRRPNDGRVEITPGLATYQVDAYLRGSRAPGSRAACVEDAFARQFVCAVIRNGDRDLLAGIKFVEAGGHEQVRQSVRILKEGGLKAIGLTDGDCADVGKDGVLSLPGGKPPERVVFEDADVVATFASSHRIDIPACLAGVTDHHDFTAVLADHMGLDAAVVATFACDAYVAGRPPSDFDELLRFVRAGLT